MSDERDYGHEHEWQDDLCRLCGQYADAPLTTDEELTTVELSERARKSDRVPNDDRPRPPWGTIEGQVTIEDAIAEAESDTTETV